MEHEATVPFPPDAVRRVLADPGRLGRCVPGLQVDAGDADAGDRGDRGGERRPDTVSGRMRVRVGGSTITYRGVLRLSAAADGTGVRAEAEGGEARGTGTVRAEMTVRTEAAGGGATILRLSGRAETTGRLAQAGPKAAESAGRRLLDRFASALTEELTASDETAGAEAGGTEPGGDEEPGVAVAGGAEAEGVPEPREAPETSGESGPSGVPGSSGAPGAGGASGTPGDARPDAPGASGAPDAGETEDRKSVV